ncbi:MAG TPA: hypothetical protein VKX29_01000 [Brumimicrobium sp.]|nr:hypothetical protein [Brumimicrobium sp.]
MNRSFGLLSILSFVGVLILALLMVFGVINFLNNFKYLVVLSSTFLTFFSLGWFIRQQELPRILYLLILFLLISPLLIPISALKNVDVLTNLWKVFIGGSVFQIGTGIYAVLGGFIKRGIHRTQKYISIFNYIIFLLLTSILIFDITFLMNVNVYIVLGSLASLLSLLLVVTKKPTISL